MIALSNRAAPGEALAGRYDPAARGYIITYRENAANHCPGCGRSHWYVGRVSAECGFCGTALPLAEAPAQGAGSWSREMRPRAWASEAVR